MSSISNDTIDSLRLKLPKHLLEFNSKMKGKSISVEDLMQELLAFGHSHITHEGCGPFVAAIQEVDTDKVLVVGANLVGLWNQGWAHAERVAIALAEKEIASYVLPEKKYRMLTSSQMCIACYGECLASGLVQIIASATGSDIEELTSLREGILPENWVDNLAAQGIEYRAEFLREEGRKFLAAYGKEGVGYFNAGKQS